MAEKNIYIDPSTTLIKLRLFAETTTKYVMAFEEINESQDISQLDRLRLLKKDGVITEDLEELFHTLRKKGNKAVHQGGYGTTEEAEITLRMAYHIGVWMMEVYGDWDYKIPDYQKPQQEQLINAKELTVLQEQYEIEIGTLKEDLDNLRKRQVYVQASEKTKRKQHAQQSSKNLQLNEDETREIIDEQLRDAGWVADTNNIRYSKGTRPEKNKDKAIAEWPVNGGRVDYALFVGLEFLGIIEAKRKSKNIPADIEQAKIYARNVEQKEDEVILESNGEYSVPFLFATNGRAYLKQIQDKSGVWFLDARSPTNHPRALQKIYSPSGLKELAKKDLGEATKKLNEEPLDYLKLRTYQEEAILAVEDALRNGKREALLALATGTGKTRLAIGLIYRLIKAKRFHRILFLVDRSALGEQAEAAFKDSKLEDYMSFTEIFNLQTLNDKSPEGETKVQIATVQGMVKRLFYQEDDSQKPTVDQYDCIIVDEAHRGYTLDKEMSETEMMFRDQKEYVSKYRQVLEYFDAVPIGLTATPALHTVDIFGNPVYTYTYREAVIDGYLIDHEPPYQFETALKQQGIRWKQGEEVDYYDPQSGEINKEMLEDEVNLDVTHFNKMVITKNFNEVVLTELSNYIDPMSLGKTLVFAATDDHADMIVNMLKEKLETIHGPVEDNAIMKITGSIKDPSYAIKQFKNERNPNIVVTVDLLTTGIDVPAITNIVFMRRVRSRILYEQMLGRATRLCEDIGKEYFAIYDAVGLYESLKAYSDMKPVVKRPKVSVEQIVDELEQIEAPAEQKQHQEELAAKIQRKKQSWNEEDHQIFETLMDGFTVTEFVQWIKGSTSNEVIELLRDKPTLIPFLDENRYRSAKQYISNHEDELIEVTRGYGKADKPEDYLEQFHTFIQENMNKIPALQVVCTRPKELTREQLRELRIALDQQGFTEAGLQTAWRDAKNEDIAADIISFVRKQAIGDPLVSHEDRIKIAMKDIYQMKSWPPVQRQWLEKIEKQLLKESILDPDPEKAFNVEPFKSRGGYKQLDIIFHGQMEEIVSKINQALYTHNNKEQA
ncbi:type I restriction-modification system endonuclease [Sinobaca qinghaiensis]|nr:type I restriction-modification system endonuclease [Sinobaca qinghaiensis]